MTQDLSVLDAANPLLRPFHITKSKMSVITKIYEKRYICNCSSVIELMQVVAEKIKELRPESCAFSYLLSYNDNTHIDGHNPRDFAIPRLSTGKRVDRLVMKWSVRHLIDEVQNEIGIMIRISNPVNPMMIFQAAMSKQPDDFDGLEFGNGCTTISVAGASPLYGDGVIQIVGGWIDARPRPEYITGVHDIYARHRGLLSWLNYWLMPLLGVSAAAIWMFKNPDSKYVIHIGMLGILAHWYLCKIAKNINDRVGRHLFNINMYSVFDITNGDSNQMTKYAAKSRNSMIKLAINAIFTIIGNIVAAAVCYYVFDFN